MIDKRPALIARCATTPDVVRAVSFARDNGLPLAVRGGGHNIAGNALCDDGLVIDLSPMKAAHGRPAGAPRHHRGRRHARRLRRRDAGPRPRHAARHQLDHRHRRPDARRRLRLAQPQVRHDHRQPRVRRGRDRRRRGGARQRDRAPRPLLGAPRRRRQLRRRHPLRVPAAPGRPGGAQRASSSTRSPRRSRCCSSTATSSRGAGRAHRLDRPAQGAAAAVPAGGGPRQGDRRARPVLRRRPEAGRAAHRAAAHSSARRSGEHVGVQPYTAWQQAFDPLLTPARATTGSRTTSRR